MCIVNFEVLTAVNVQALAGVHKYSKNLGAPLKL